MIASGASCIAETDEELMEKYFNDEPFTPEEIRKGVVAGIAAGVLVFIRRRSLR